MIKNFLFAMVLLSLCLAVGCAKGGNGVVTPPPSIAVTDGDNAAIGATLPVTFTATVSGTTNTAVTWSVSGTNCSGSACGTITPITPATNPATAVYVAPATAPTPAASVTITATLQSDSTITGSLGVNVVPVSVVVTPTVVTVGENLVQQFTAVAVPDAAPQTFSWSCSPSNACSGFVPGANNSGVAVYTAPSGVTANVVISATSTIPESPLGVGTSRVAVAVSRLASNSTYAFQFSGFNSVNANNPVAVLGNVITGANGSIVGGFEDVLPAPTSGNPLAITSGSFTPSSNSDNNDNDLGTITLNFSNGSTNSYTAVLNSAGNFQMIESDSTGITGSGVMQKSSASTGFNSAGQTFAFGFTGVEVGGNRVGYVGQLPMTPSAVNTCPSARTACGTIASGSLDSNDNGTTTSVCGLLPCAVSGSYSLVDPINALWQMTLSAGGKTLNFDFIVAAGTAQTKTGPNALTLYAISTDPIAANPAVSGSMVYQVPMTYNNAALAGSSVSALTGTNPMVAHSSNVALVLGTTDGTSGGSGGTGGYTGNFDQNDNGTILSVSAFPAAGSSSNPYTYVATNGTNGRYIIQMLGNPTANPVTAPIPFVLYASGANRGFLLDQTSENVFTGAMFPQPTASNFGYAPSELPGTYAASPIPNSTLGITPFVQNLLLTSTGNSTYNVTGTLNTGSGNQSLSGTYNFTGLGNGTGSITLTSPPAPASSTNVIYAIDATTIANPLNSSFPNFVVTDFFEMGTTSGTPSALIFAQQ